MGAALRLVGFADLGGGALQAGQCPEEPPVRLVLPAHVAAPPPPVGPQRVETPVVAHPVGGVLLDHIASCVTEQGPSLQ